MQDIYINKAIQQAKKAMKDDNVPVGAVITLNNDLIASAHNSKIPYEHAEFLVIKKAYKKIGENIRKASIYVTLEPCAMCCSMISLVKIPYLFFGAYDIKYGACDHNPKVFDHSLFKTKFFGGIKEKECKQLLQNYFKQKRLK